MTTCPGSGQRAATGDGQPVCPVCFRRRSIGLPARFSRADVIVPLHEVRVVTR